MGTVVKREKFRRAREQFSAIHAPKNLDKLLALAHSGTTLLLAGHLLELLNEMTTCFVAFLQFFGDSVQTPAKFLVASTILL
jgi:hypothetical protein